MDNRSHEEAKWDLELLPLELVDLQSLGTDLALSGFDEDELARLITPATFAGLTDENAVPEPPAEPISKLGDVWLLGGHRLVCGDCTDASVVAMCLNGVKPHLTSAYTFVAPERQNELTRRIQRKLAEVTKPRVPSPATPQPPPSLVDNEPVTGVVQ
jgi:hypothetical protein